MKIPINIYNYFGRRNGLPTKKPFSSTEPKYTGFTTMTELKDRNNDTSHKVYYTDKHAPYQPYFLSIWYDSHKNTINNGMSFIYEFKQPKNISGLHYAIVEQLFATQSYTSDSVIPGYNYTNMTADVKIEYWNGSSWNLYTGTKKEVVTKEEQGRAGTVSKSYGARSATGSSQTYKNITLNGSIQTDALKITVEPSEQNTSKKVKFAKFFIYGDDGGQKVVLKQGNSYLSWNEQGIAVLQQTKQNAIVFSKKLLKDNKVLYRFVHGNPWFTKVPSNSYAIPNSKLYRNYTSTSDGTFMSNATNAFIKKSNTIQWTEMYDMDYPGYAKNVSFSEDGTLQLYTTQSATLTEEIADGSMLVTQPIKGDPIVPSEPVPAFDPSPFFIDADSNTPASFSDPSMKNCGIGCYEKEDCKGFVFSEETKACINLNDLSKRTNYPQSRAYRKKVKVQPVTKMNVELKYNIDNNYAIVGNTYKPINVLGLEWSLPNGYVNNMISIASQLTESKKGTHSFVPFTLQPVNNIYNVIVNNQIVGKLSINNNRYVVVK